MANQPNGDAAETKAARPRRTIATAQHVCRILDALSQQRSATLTGIARSVALRPSSVHHLLKTLEQHEYVTFDANRRMYTLGAAIARLAGANPRETLSDLSRPLLAQVRDATGETAALQLRDGDVRYCALELPSTQPIRMELTETARYPVSRGASGDVLRAFSCGWRSEGNRAALLRVRRDGYAISHGSLLRGAVAVYVPVIDRSGEAIAAIGVHGPEFRMHDADVAGIVRRLQAVAGDIAQRVHSGVTLR